MIKRSDKIAKQLGFFNLDDVAKKNATLAGTDLNCEKCGLYKYVRSPKMPVSGRGEKKALFLAEAPGGEEDARNTQLVGPSGELLQKNLLKVDLNLDRDFWRINAVNCRPMKDGSNRTPTKKEVEYCRPKWQKAMEELNPEFVVLAGGKALEAYFGNRKSKIFTEDLSIGRWRRLCIPDPVTEKWVIPILHPSFVLRQPDMEGIFQEDLEFVRKCLNYDTARNILRPNGEITILRYHDDIISYLRGLEDKVSLDFETNSLKPFYPDSKILTIGLSADGVKGTSFPYQYPGVFTEEQQKSIRTEIVRLLRNPKVMTIVHNRTMEEVWCMEKFVKPQNMRWDSCIAAHVLDERDKHSGLKFQAFINWGILDYDKEVEPYKKSVGDSVYNRLHLVPWPTICRYNAMDAIVTRRLYGLQFRKIYDLRSNTLANDFLQEGAEPLSKMTKRGVPIDIKYHEKVSDDLALEAKELEQAMMNGSEAKLWRQRETTPFDPNSRDVLEKLFFTHMKLKPVRETVTGKRAVDGQTLERLDVPLAKQIIRSRWLSKTNDYIQRNLKLSAFDPKTGLYLIHPTFNLNLATSYRSSSDGPNLHNYPKRDKEAYQLIRTGIIAPPGYQFVAADFGAMEVRGFAWYSKDPVLVRELREGMDPHGVWAEFLKVSRFDAKNTFVFPLIYGSYWKTITADFRFRGYAHITEDLVQEAERKFWDKYNYAKEWQNRLLYNYYKTGYVETFLGFKRRGILTRNQVVNFPIQSTCFHCLVWCYRRLDKIQERERWQSYQIGQIHDENLFLCKPEETAHVCQTIEKVMVNELMQEYDWINVPPLAEFSLSPVSGSWAQMEDYTKAMDNDWEYLKENEWPKAA